MKGKDYFDFPSKYYCEDLGLRNARIGFRQQEMPHIMENIIYNELIIRGCAVDIGIVYSSEKDSKGRSVQTAREIDFVAVMGGGGPISNPPLRCRMKRRRKRRTSPSC